MQLFYLAKEQLTHVMHYLAALQKVLVVPNAGSARPANVEVPLPLIEIEMAEEEAVGEDAHAIMVEENPAGGEEAEPPVERIRQGINDFVNSSLFVAVEGMLGKESAPTVKLADYMAQQGQSSIVFQALPDDISRFSNAFVVLEQMEKMMFAGWRGEAQGLTLQKNFLSERERELTEHLFCCMGEAYGFSQEEIEEAFEGSPDTTTMVVDQEFMQIIVELEQTLEADFKGQGSGSS